MNSRKVQNWEAAMAAGHFKLDNLVLIIDRNSLQLADYTEKIMGLNPLDDKLRSFGFHLSKVNGNDPDAVADVPKRASIRCRLSPRRHRQDNQRQGNLFY